MNNSLSYSCVNSSINDICEVQKLCLDTQTNSNLDDFEFVLPHIGLFPKFHKLKFSQRFVISYSNCSIKPLAKLLTLALKAVYNQVCSYANMLFKVTGIKRNCIIKTKEPLLNCFDGYLVSESTNIQTYDFSTLYTNLKHDEIKVALTSVMKLAFKHSNCKFISIYNKSFAWVNSPKNSTFRFDEVSLLEYLEFLMNNCYFTLGDKVFRQIIGVFLPIGVDPRKLVLRK